MKVTLEIKILFFSTVQAKSAAQTREFKPEFRLTQLLWLTVTSLISVAFCSSMQLSPAKMKTAEDKAAHSQQLTHQSDGSFSS